MPSYLDLAVFIVVAFSSLLAVLRGFKRTLLAILSWVASGVMAYFFYPLALPFIKPFVSKIGTASALAIASVFFGALIISTVCTATISGVLLGSHVSIRDRALGLIYGSLRGILLSIIGFGIYAWLVPDADQPIWVRNGYTRPILQSSSEALRAFMPESVDSVIAKIKAKIVVPESEALPAETKAETAPPQPGVGGLATMPSPEALPRDANPKSAPPEPADNTSPAERSQEAQPADAKSEKAQPELSPVPSPTTPAPGGSPVEAKPEKIPSEPAPATPASPLSTELPAAGPTPEKTMPGLTAASPSVSPIETKPPGNPN